MGRYVNKRYKTKRRTRDLDQIYGDDLSSDQSIINLQDQKLDEDLPGLGQYYCIPCAKYFETEIAKRTHQRGKIHKRRLKELKEGAYTKEEADAAAGHNVAKFMAKKQEMEAKQHVPVVKELLTMPDKKKEREEEDTKEEQKMDLE